MTVNSNSKPSSDQLFCYNRCRLWVRAGESRFTTRKKPFHVQDNGSTPVALLQQDLGYQLFQGKAKVTSLYRGPVYGRGFLHLMLSSTLWCLIMRLFLKIIPIKIYFENQDTKSCFIIDDRSNRWYKWSQAMASHWQNTSFFCNEILEQKCYVLQISTGWQKLAAFRRGQKWL